MSPADQERVEALRKAGALGLVAFHENDPEDPMSMDMYLEDVEAVLRAIVTELGITQEMVAELRQLADGLNDNGMPETAAVIHAHADMLSILLAAGGGE